MQLYPTIPGMYGGLILIFFVGIYIYIHTCYMYLLCIYIYILHTYSPIFLKQVGLSWTKTPCFIVPFPTLDGICIPREARASRCGHGGVLLEDPAGRCGRGQWRGNLKMKNTCG